MALVGVSGVSKYGFYIPIGVLRLYELHLILEPAHPMLHHELLLFLPLDCMKLNIYLHGKKERFHASFLQNLLEQIYDKAISENGILDFSENFLISTHPNNRTYESRLYSYVKLLQTSGDGYREVLIDGISANVYLDLVFRMIDLTNCVKLEISRKSQIGFKAGVMALRFSTLLANPNRKNPYEIHLFTPGILGEEYSLFEDERQAILNSFVLNYVHKEKGLSDIEDILNKSLDKTAEAVKKYSSGTRNDIYKIISEVNSTLNSIKTDIINYFDNIESGIPHSDLWLQIPEFVFCRDISKKAKEENYSWDFVFNEKPVKSLVSKHFLDNTKTYHIYISDLLPDKILISSADGGCKAEFEMDFGLDPNWLWVMIYPIYYVFKQVLKLSDKLLLSKFVSQSDFKTKLSNWDKINTLRWKLFIKDVYKDAFSFQNLLNVFLIMTSLMFTLSSIMIGKTGNTNISRSKYFDLVFSMVTSPVIYIPALVSVLSIFLFYMVSSYRKTKRRWN